MVNDFDYLDDGSGVNNYYNNSDCSWLIQPTNATSITLSFDEFNLEEPSSDGNTIYDAIEVYDGTDTTGILLGRFTGSNIPNSVTSSGGSMFIHFFSDFSVNDSGWSAYYTTITNTYCNANTTLITSSGSFNDGSGVNQYGNNSDCKWLIQPTGATSITLNFVSFDTEQNYDGVIVYDGVDTSATQLGLFTGSTIPSPVTSTGGSMLVWFLSDEIIRDVGFSANYSSTSTGIEENSIASTLSIYPNPNNGNFTLQSFNNIPYSINIYNPLGENIYEQKNILSSLIEIDLSKQANGIYFIQIRSEKESFNKKIIINKN